MNTLDLSFLKVPAIDHGVLLLHGFTACPSQLVPLAKALNENGYSVSGILLPGHGQNYEAMRKSTWRDWLGAARDAALEMRKRYSRFTLGGLSMGGCLSLLLCNEVKADACVCIAAPMGTAKKSAKYAKALSILVPQVRSAPRKKPLPLQEYDLQYTVYPTVKVDDLNQIIRLSKDALSFVSCPLLAFQSKKDPTILPASMDIILQNVSSAVKKGVWMEEENHILTLGNEREKLFRETLDFLHTNVP